MIQGKIQKTWTTRDLKSLKFREGNPTKTFSKKKIVQSTGAFICNDLPKKFLAITKKFKLEESVVAVQKMEVGQVLPWHKDGYVTFIKNKQVKDKKNIVRIIVFLDASLPGHQLWIGDRLCTGDAGTYFGWNYDTEHMAANLGKQDRYTLQITGVKKD